MNRTVYLSYIITPTFSGQTASSILLIDLLKENGWNCRIIPLYPFIRGKKTKLRATIEFVRNQFITINSLFSLIKNRNAILYINLGQSLPSFFRVGIWFIPLKFFNPSRKCVISLNGSVFQTWQLNDLKTKIFKFIINKSEIITVVGDNQKKSLNLLGIDIEKIFVVPNTFDIANKKIKKSPESIINSKRKFNLLHLSLLIESKGFPEYLEALEIISNITTSFEIEAVLCGPLSFTSYCKRFKNSIEKTLWIEEKINQINKGKNVKINWIKGASGEVKKKLYDDCDLFVFPTQFPVEAQPLVLLEAMASECAIITTNVGEIPSTVDHNCAVILDKINAQILANSIIDFCENPTLLKKFAENGRLKVKQEFSKEVYLNNWLKILTQLNF